MLQQGLQRYLLPEELEKLRAAQVGIAGVGGLGSNVAMLLVRSGVQKLVLIDKDKVDASNLNRQHYFPRHVNMPKVEAMAEILRELCPSIELELHCLELNAAQMPTMLSSAPLWVEAFDDALSKRMFVEASLQHNCFCVSASGIAGYGGASMQSRALGKNLVVVGDFNTDVADAPPLAPRVMQAAAMQADIILTHILNAL